MIEFEKELYLAINLMRLDPKSFVDIAEKGLKKESKQIRGAGIIDALKKAGPMNAVRFDDQANAACRQVNQAIYDRNEANPTAGGIVDKYKQLLGPDKACTAAEQSIFKYDGGGGWAPGPEHFLMFVCAKDILEKGSAPLLDPNVTKIGLSKKGHNKVVNSTQLCYVYETQNAMF